MGVYKGRKRSALDTVARPPGIVACQESDMIREFIHVYRLYRTVHTRRYAAWIAWQIAVRGTPF
jgi:2-phosphoglycerate kinase